LKACCHTCAALIKAHGVLGDLDKSRDVWKNALVERSAESNNIVLGCWLDVLVSNHCVDEAVSVFNEVKGLITPNLILYSTLIKGFAVEGRTDAAMALWSNIRQSGVKMNTVIYNGLIDAQARQGCTEKIDELLVAMEEDGIAKDHITICTVLKGFCTNGNLDRAFQVYHGLLKEAGRPDCVVYNTLLDGCIQHHRMDLADQAMADMLRFKVKPSSFTLGILVKMYGRRRQLDQAFQIVDTMREEHGLLPNMQVWTCLMSACIYNKDLDRGVKVFSCMKENGNVDARAYAVLLNGFLRANRVTEAVELVDEAYGLSTGKRMLPDKQFLSNDNMERLFQTIKYHGLEELGSSLVERLRAAKVLYHYGAVAVLDGPRWGSSGRRDDPQHSVDATRSTSSQPNSCMPRQKLGPVVRSTACTKSQSRGRAAFVASASKS